MVYPSIVCQPKIFKIKVYCLVVFWSKPRATHRCNGPTTRCPAAHLSTYYVYPMYFLSIHVLYIQPIFSEPYCRLWTHLSSQSLSLQWIRSPARTLLSVVAEPLEWPQHFCVPKSTWWVLVKIQGDRNRAETQMKMWWKFEHFLTTRSMWKVTLKSLNGYFR